MDNDTWNIVFLSLWIDLHRPIIYHSTYSLGHFKKGHSDKGHKEEKKGEEDEKKTKYFDEDGDEAHDEKKGNIPFHFNWKKLVYLIGFNWTYCIMDSIIGSFEEHYGSKKGGHHKKGHKKG